MIVNNQPIHPDCKFHNKPVALVCFNKTCQSRLLCLHCLRSHEGSHNSYYIDIDEFLNKDPLIELDKMISQLELKEKVRITKADSLLCEIECICSALQESFSRKFNDLKEKIVNSILQSQIKDNLNTRLAEKIANSRGELEIAIKEFKFQGSSYDEFNGIISKYIDFKKSLIDELEYLNPNNFTETISNGKKQDMMKEFEMFIDKNIQLLDQEIQNVLKKAHTNDLLTFNPESIQLSKTFSHEQTGGCWIQGFAYMKAHGVNIAVVGDDKGSLKLWDVQKNSLLYDHKEKKGEKSKICSLLAYPKTSQIVVSYANQIRIYDILPNFGLSLHKILNHHKCDIYALENLDGTDYIVSAEWDNDSKKLFIWRIDTGYIRQEITLKFGCYSIRQLRGRDIVAIGHWKGSITLYELDNNNFFIENKFLIGHLDTVVDFAWDDVSRMLFSSSDDMTIRQWYLPQGTCVRVFDMKREKAGNLQLFYNTDFIICTAYDGTMKIFRISTGELVNEIQITQNFKPMLIALKNRKELISRDKSHIKIWSFN